MSVTAADDPFDEFWALFGAELDEYLSTIESILAASPVDMGRVDELFRAFHSVKGGSAALALRCIEKVAHAAEDVLHQVRAGKRVLTTDVVSALLEAVDEMRRLQDTAMATRQDQPVNAAIVAKLKTYLVDGNAPPVAPSVSAPAPEPAMDADLMAAFAALGAAPTDEAAAVSVAAPPLPLKEPALQIAPETLSGLQDAVLGLVGVVDGDAEMWGEVAAVLAEIADEAGLHGLARAALRVMSAGEWGWQDLLARLRAVETATGESLGSFALAASLEVRLGELLAEQVASLKTAPGDVALWLRVVRLLAVLELDTAAELADAAVTSLLLDETPSAALAEADEAAADLFALAGISLASGIEPPRAELAALRDTRFGLAGVTAAAEPAVPVGTTYPWPGDVLARLGLEVAAGNTPALVLLDLESDLEHVQAVCERLFGAHCLYNRSRLDLGDGLFEYLLAVEGPVADFTATLTEADPGHTVVRSVNVADAEAQPVVEAGDEPVLGAPVPALATAPVAAAAGVIPAPAVVPSTAAVPAPVGAARAADPMVRVPSAAIDGFMDMIGEMRLGLTALGMVLEQPEPGGPRTALDGRVRDEFSRLERTVRALYDGAIALRVVPIGTLFNRLLRPVRDTAVLVGKAVSLSTAGEDVQVDKAMIEMLVDPLTHIVRNSVDHGIEAPEGRKAAGKPAEGVIQIRARQGASMAVIEVEDDGGGIDVNRVRDKAVAKGLIGRSEADALADDDAIQLILLPGFSTRDEVTATSGRGVGMDIVVTAIRKLGGRLTIDSVLGRGTRMVIEFPISAAMQRVVTTTVAGQPIAIHERTVREVVHVPGDRLQRVGRRMTLSLRNAFLPVVDLAHLLGFADASPAGNEHGRLVVIVIDDGDEQLGLLTRHMALRQEVFFKKLHPLIERNPLIAGAAVNGAGGVLFALDTPSVIKRALRWLEP